MIPADVDYFVVGGDGFIGSRLAEKLRLGGSNVVTTTRRLGSIPEGSVRLDLGLNFNLSSCYCPQSGSVAFFCAGITDMLLCETDSRSSIRVNVTNTLALAEKLCAAGVKTVFLSSNAVFDGTIMKPEESFSVCPTTEYGRQKVAAERGLLALTDSIVIIRLSKVLTAAVGIAERFIKQLMANETCRAFDDLRMSPISLSYVVDAIVAIANSKSSGVFHLSGAEEMTCAEFARSLAIHLGVDSALVQPLSSITSGVNVLFRPAHPLLGMKRTNQLLGIEPESTEHLLKNLLIERRFS